MTIKDNKLISRIWQRLFPPMPDFYQLLNRQCDLVTSGTTELTAYMNSSDDSHAEKVIALERQGDMLKAEYMTTLHQAFATPFDREDIYRAFSALEEVINYLNSTVTEMRVLNISPDKHTRVMADLLHEGVLSLQKGFARLATQPLAAEADADNARQIERAVERIYRKALAELFDANHYVASLTLEQQEAAESLDVLMQTLNKREVSAVGSVAGFMVDILKRREVYRHMSNAADRVAHAGEILHDIVVKIT
ncbi:DUF47 domain-containing protein [Colwellia sp. MEBiC06753]